VKRLLALLVAVLALGAWQAWRWVEVEVLDGLPDDLSHLQGYRPPSACRVLAADGTEVDRFYAERRFWVPLDELPDALVRSVLVAEDRSFREHAGVDPRGISRALRANLEAGRVVQGGSTITQQVVKQLLTGRERTLRRKAQEAVLAWRLERQLGKDPILELYLNLVALGAGNYGVEAAAQAYFGVSARAVDDGQAALLAGLIPSPSAWSPTVDPQAAASRRRLVLEARVALGDLSAAEAAPHYDAPVLLPPKERDGPWVPAYATAVRRVLTERLGDAPTRHGLVVRTALDLELQAVAQQALARGLKAHAARQGAETKRRGLEPGTPWAQGAIVVVENATGRVLALVGGTDVELEGFERATQAKRQPGSTFKAFLYGAKLATGGSAADPVWPAPKVEGWVDPPAPTRLRAALAASSNEAAKHLYRGLPPGALVRVARDLGVDAELRDDGALAPGGSEVTPWQLAQGFVGIARLGSPVELALVDAVEDLDGAVVGRRGGEVVVGRPLGRLPGAVGPRALEEGVAFELLDMLREVFRSGTARAFRGVGRAGKTGTSDDYRDAWFAGMTPDHTVVVWVGVDDRSPLGDDEYGGVAALPIWAEVVQHLQGPEPRPFTPSPRAVRHQVGGARYWLRRGGPTEPAYPRPRVGDGPIPGFLRGR
jgi:penicillin-binding protein 1A